MEIHAQPQVSSATAGTSADSRPVVLIVDDSKSNLAFLCHILGQEYEVLSAQSGERALEIAVGAPKPDLILLDVVMPGMSGYDVLTGLRNTPETCDIPVIFTTGLDSTVDEEKGLELGAVDYITKPYRAPIVLARVRSQIELKQSRDRLSSQNNYLEGELAKRLQEAQQAQSRLLQSEKLAAVGQLSAGIVHEINTPVGFVTSNLTTLASYWQDILKLLDAYETLEALAMADAAALNRIRSIKQECDIAFLRDDTAKLIAESQDGLARVTAIVRDLKNFSRAEDIDNRQWTDLHSGLDATVNIVWSEIKYHCTLRKDYGELPKIYCNPSQINQVVLNLIVNAAQAIPDKGEITIRTGQTDSKAFIAIADTGTGIPAETLPRLFEPFFTTKPVGKGTGLGLSIAYGIMQRHQGSIEVSSIQDKGTTFTLWLPLKPADAGTMP
ncbi:MAG: hybrid sensor histidine kinase/response regulator [Betaproteobacteria bacterium HGW-Betaproteobacteria-14]|nr:MAG: hybrid sensor histidine kinase/response regulator [Betaproteobacteria bacterium HGW-Betaproteobacteria-14]